MRMQAWVLAAAVVTGAAGCGRAAQTTWAAYAVAEMLSEVSLRVQNNTRTTMRIFVVDGGAWRSIGTVAGASTTGFAVPGLDRSGAPLRILATSVDGRGAARAGPLTVLPGQTVTFTIETDLARSFAVVH